MKEALCAAGGVLCMMVCLSTATNPSQIDRHNEIQTVLRKMMFEGERKSLVWNSEKLFIHSSLREKDDNLKSCSCHETTCGCCVHVKMDSIHLDDTVCLNASYLPKEIGVEVALVLDGKVLFSEKVSAKNPPPICADVPYLKKLASLCLRLYNLDYGSDHFSGCAELEARLAGMVLEKVNLGCFKFPIASGIEGESVYDLWNLVEDSGKDLP